MYSPLLLDHFENPRHAGEVKDPSVVVRIENPACGDILELTAKIEDRRVVDIRFRAKGCVPTIACGSALTELIKGRGVEDAGRITRAELVGRVGGLPQASEHASHLAMDALAELLKSIREDQVR